MTSVDHKDFWQLDSAPDSHVALRGYRLMTVRGTTEEIQGHKAKWPENTMRAECLAEYRWSSHTAPAAKCTCGLYNAYTPSVITESLQFPWLFVTESIGQMYLGKPGFRAQQTTLIAAAPSYRRNVWNNAPEPVSVSIERQALFLRRRGIRTYKTRDLLLRDYPPAPPPGVQVYSPWDVEE